MSPCPRGSSSENHHTQRTWLGPSRACTVRRDVAFCSARVCVALARSHSASALVVRAGAANPNLHPWLRGRLPRRCSVGRVGLIRLTLVELSHYPPYIEISSFNHREADRCQCPVSARECESRVRSQV